MKPTRFIAALSLVLLLTLTAVPLASAAPEVTSVTPNTGPIGGGTNIVIAGTGFVAGATVAIGGTAATGVVVNSATEIVATTPAKAAGTYNLVVTLPDTTTYTKANAFTYAATPTITTLSPASGPTAGGTVVTMTGTNFRAGATVTFGGTAGTSVVVNSATEIVVTTPAKAAGAYNVVVTNSDTSTYTKASGFTFGDQPTITAVAPATVGTAGGASVQVTGTNFRTGATMTVGGTAFTGVTVNSATELVATAPAKVEGTYNVVVTVDGLSYAKANALSYVPVTNPTIASLSPATGSTAGGASVNIAGTGFMAGATVTFGGTAGTSVVVASPTEIQVVAPAKVAGTHNVVVTNSNGGSATKLNAWAAVAPPTVTAVSPNSGTVSGGTAVTLTGTGFATGATVAFDGIPATEVIRVSATSITAKTPAHPSGAVTVEVGSNGLTGSLASAYTYGLPGEPGYTLTGVASATANSGKFSDMAVDGDTVLIAHSVGASNQLTFTISFDGGNTWSHKVPGGLGAGSTWNRVAMLSDTEWGAAIQVGTNGARSVITTRDGGATFTSADLGVGYGAGAADASNGAKVSPPDLDGEGDTYIATVANRCEGGGGLCGAGTNVAGHFAVHRSANAGLTWAATTLYSDNAGADVIGQYASSVNVISDSSWMYAVTEETGFLSGAGRVKLQITTNSGSTYQNVDYGGGTYVNDPFNPLTNYGRGVLLDHQTTAKFTFRNSDNTVHVASVDLSASRYLFTQVSAHVAASLPNTAIKIAATAATAGVVYTQTSQTADWFRFALTTDGATAWTTEAPVAGDPTSKPWALPGVFVTCPTYWISYQDPVALTMKVSRAERVVDCGGEDVESIEVATDGLRGFDMSPGGLDTTIITRENDGMVRTYDPTTLSMRAEADSRCNDRADGVAALFPDVNYLFCDEADAFDVDGFRVKNFFLDTDPLICPDGCATSGESPGVISEENDAFIDSPEGMGQIGYSSRYPWTFENRYTSFGKTVTPLVFPFTIQGTGQFGIYAIELREDDVDPDGFELEQFASNGQTVSQMCTFRTETNGRDLIGVVHPTAGLRLYSFTVGFSSTVLLPPGDLNDITIDPYMTAPGSSAEAVGIACAGDVVMFATADTAAAPGKVVAFYADGPKRGQKLFEIADVDPVQRGVALSAALEYAAYTDLTAGETVVHYLAINGTELTTRSIGNRNFYQMAIDRPGGTLVVANAPEVGTSAPTGSLMRFDMTAIEGGCGLNCTDTNADPFDTQCGTGCGQDDPLDTNGDGVIDGNDASGSTVKVACRFCFAASNITNAFGIIGALTVVGGATGAVMTRRSAALATMLAGVGMAWGVVYAFQKGLLLTWHVALIAFVMVGLGILAAWLFRGK